MMQQQKQLQEALKEKTSIAAAAAAATELDSARGNLTRLRAEKDSLEKEIHIQMNQNQILNLRVSELESQVNILNNKLSENGPNLASQTAEENAKLRQDLVAMAKERELLLTSLSQRKLEISQPHSQAAQLLLASETEKADHDFALSNAQAAIASLEAELEELQDSIREEQAEAEMQRLLLV